MSSKGRRLALAEGRDGGRHHQRPNQGTHIPSSAHIGKAPVPQQTAALCIPASPTDRPSAACFALASAEEKHDRAVFVSVENSLDPSSPVQA